MALTASLLVLAITACSGTATPSTTSSTTTTLTAPTTVPPTTPSTAVIDPPPETATLTVWADPSLADAVRSRAQAFANDTGAQVTVVPMSEGDILGALSDDSAGAPDVFIGPHTWLYQLAVAGLTEPVRLGADLPAGAVQAVSLRTFSLAVPLAVDALIEARNPSISPILPTAVEELSSCVGCFVLPADGDLDTTYPFLASLGGYLFGRNADTGYDLTDTGVDSAEAIAAAVTLQDLVGAGAVDTATDRTEVLTRFAAGEAGIIWAGPEAVDLLSGQTVEALPSIGGEPAVSPVRVLAAYVNAKGPAKSEAARFAVDYLGDPDGSRAIADASTMAPVWSSVATAAEQAIIESARTGQPVPFAPTTETAWSTVSAAFAAILTGTDAETAMVDAGDLIRFADSSGQEG
jgi:arabinogalactan oligomer/maltooligosaccharide transport system substrate-binding protein